MRLNNLSNRQSFIDGYTISNQYNTIINKFNNIPITTDPLYFKTPRVGKLCELDIVETAILDVITTDNINLISGSSRTTYSTKHNSLFKFTKEDVSLDILYITITDVLFDLIEYEENCNYTITQTIEENAAVILKHDGLLRSDVHNTGFSIGNCRSYQACLEIKLDFYLNYTLDDIPDSIITPILDRDLNYLADYNRICRTKNRYVSDTKAKSRYLYTRNNNEIHKGIPTTTQRRATITHRGGFDFGGYTHSYLDRDIITRVGYCFYRKPHTKDALKLLSDEYGGIYTELLNGIYANDYSLINKAEKAVSNLIRIKPDTLCENIENVLSVDTITFNDDVIDDTHTEILDDNLILARDTGYNYNEFLNHNSTTIIEKLNSSIKTIIPDSIITPILDRNLDYLADYSRACRTKNRYVFDTKAKSRYLYTRNNNEIHKGIPVTTQRRATITHRGGFDFGGYTHSYLDRNIITRVGHYFYRKPHTKDALKLLSDEYEGIYTELLNGIYANDSSLINESEKIVSNLVRITPDAICESIENTLNIDNITFNDDVIDDTYTHTEILDDNLILARDKGYNYNEFLSHNSTIIIEKLNSLTESELGSEIYSKDLYPIINKIRTYNPIESSSKDNIIEYDVVKRYSLDRYGSFNYTVVVTEHSRKPSNTHGCGRCSYGGYQHNHILRNEGLTRIGINHYRKFFIKDIFPILINLYNGIYTEIYLGYLANDPFYIKLAEHIVNNIQEIAFDNVNIIEELELFDNFFNGSDILDSSYFTVFNSDTVNIELDLKTELETQLDDTSYLNKIYYPCPHSSSIIHNFKYRHLPNYNVVNNATYSGALQHKAKISLDSKTHNRMLNGVRYGSHIWLSGTIHRDVISRAGSDIFHNSIEDHIEFMDIKQIRRKNNEVFNAKAIETDMKHDYKKPRGGLGRMKYDGTYFYRPGEDHEFRTLF